MTVFFKIGRRTAHSGKLDLSRVPKHIGIIMDGNGRWAKRRGLPRRAGHKPELIILREYVIIATQ